MGLILLLLPGCFKKTYEGNTPGFSGTSRPWTYWWWMGSAVDTANLARNLRSMHEAGIGGVHIIPIYGVRGEESRYIDYLSPRWKNMLAFVSSKTGDLGMGVDMTLGTGWCYGGEHVNEENGLMAVDIDTMHTVKGPVSIDLSVENDYLLNRLICVLCVLSDGKRTDITSRVSDKQVLEWDGPGCAQLYILRMYGPAFSVKRAAPGGEGFLLDPFSAKAFESYTTPFERTFKGGLNKYVRSIYHDSYEYYHGNWSRGFFDEFEKRRGYKIQSWLPELFGMADTSVTRRLRADYRQTMAELHLEYISTIGDWADGNRVGFRNQAHGSPANWLDVYAVSTIPETETFGSSPFRIRGLTREKKHIREDVPSPLVLKFASSSAHVTGKKLVACETHTWLREHFRVALSHCKPELDQLFVSGINHVFYHGTAYSPRDAKWPGWLFYASANFAPSNSFYHHFPAMNEYVANCQKVLQTASPDQELLVYFPVHDVWHKGQPGDRILYGLTVHNYRDWLTGGFFEAISILDSLSFSFDYISDDQLRSARYHHDRILTEGNKYKALIIPGTSYMPYGTLEKIEELAREGAKIMFLRGLPGSVPGFNAFHKRQQKFNSLKNKILQKDFKNLKWIFPGNAVSKQDAAWIGRLSKTLTGWEIRQEAIGLEGLDYLRMKTTDGYAYFVSNLYAGKRITGYFPVSVPADRFEVYDPLTEERGAAETRKRKGITSVFIDMKQGQSLLVFALSGGKKRSLSRWKYYTRPADTLHVEGTWELEFLEGGPTIPSPVKLKRLRSWTTLPDTMAQYFSGLARYRIEFDMPELQYQKYLLVFEAVKESAQVRLNGQALPVLFAHPFELRIDKLLKEGKNKLEIDVANLSANRIIYLEKQGVNWKKFDNINFVNIRYRPFDASGWEPVESGLIGRISVVGYK